MKLPVTISVKYISESDLPIMTVNSLHVISEDEDLAALANYVNTFSELTFTPFTICHVIEQCQKSHVYNVKSDIEWLSFSLT